MKGYKMNNQRLEKVKKQHMSALGELGKRLQLSMKVDAVMDDVLTVIKRTADELVLVSNNFECQACKRESSLQFHHLVERDVAPFISFRQYMAARYYYGNITLLCNKCHAKYHGQTPSDEKGTISHDKILEVKKTYGA